MYVKRIKLFITEILNDRFFSILHKMKCMQTATKVYNYEQIISSDIKQKLDFVIAGGIVFHKHTLIFFFGDDIYIQISAKCKKIPAVSCPRLQNCCGEYKI